MKLQIILSIFTLTLVLVSCDSVDQTSNPTQTPPTTPSVPLTNESTSVSADIVIATQALSVPLTNESISSSPTDTIPSTIAVRSLDKLVDTPLHQANTAIFRENEIIYVTAPSAVVDMDGTTISLPIGSSLEVKGPATTCLFESDFKSEAICVWRRWDIFGPQIEVGFPEGLASANRFGHEPPNLNNLLFEFDKTPVDNRDLRKELADKAISLNPWSAEAYKRLRNVLNEIGDPAMIESAENTFQRYQKPQPQIAQGEYPTLFHYDGDKITPFVENKGGVIIKSSMPAVGHRGTFVHVHDADHKVGSAVTTLTYVIGEGLTGTYTTISGNPVKNIHPDGKPTDSKLPGIYATNFSWQERSKALPPITNDQKEFLKKILEGRVANYTAEATSVAKEAIKSGKIIFLSGQLSTDGRTFLVGGLVVGSASDEHYNDMPYVSEFAILEQQKDGSFINAKINAPNFSREYCNVSDILRDINGDGTDEIITYCNSGVEGPYEDYLNGILQRTNNQWSVAF